MGLWDIALGGIAYALIGKTCADIEEEKKRKATQCKFQDGISETDFRRLVIKSAKYIKRIIDLSVDGPVVNGTVSSQSGTSEWDFTIDFNDYGHITGKYWISADNKESNIPNRLAENISSLIKAYPEDVLKEKIAAYKETKELERRKRQEEKEKQYRISQRKARFRRNVKIMIFIFILAAIVMAAYTVHYIYTVLIEIL